MEAGRSLVSSPLQLSVGSHIRNRSSSSSATLTPHYPNSVLIQDQRNDGKLLLCVKEDPTFQKTLDVRLTLASSSTVDPNQRVNDSQLQLLRRPELWYLLASLKKKETSIPMTEYSFSSKSEDSTGLEGDHAVALARKAFSASEEAISISEDAELLGVHVDDSSCIRGLASVPMDRTVRSNRRLERQAKRRQVPKPNVEFQETNHQKNPGSHRKFYDGFDPNDPLRLFLRGPETTQLLTASEESELIMKIQELMKLQEVRTRLCAQFSREPTPSEWATAAGVSSQSLKSQVHIGNSSRQKLIYANFRLVVHIAKQYQGRGLNLQDLLQEGSLGLMKSVEKFKPQVGCRFATYAYWWIRQSVRKALFQHSRTIRLPENVYGLLSKVYEAKKTCAQQGNHNPCREDIAACAGISVERMEKLLQTTRVPLSMQQSVWMDQDTTYQEITADTTIEVPDVGVSKQLMRQHVRNLLSLLNPRERKIIRLRFGIDDGKPKSLSEIGDGFGLSKERVRQLESRALYKLKQCLSSQGLEAYADMLI